MHIFLNISRLFRILFRAWREPAVQGAFSLALTLIIISTIFYWITEGWSILDSAYFSVVTIATVGFGDLVPKTGIGKLYTIFYIFAGIGIFVAAVTALAHSALRIDQELEKQDMRKRSMDDNQN
jgi:CBS domain containing-hemolysin-like protein